MVLDTAFHGKQRRALPPQTNLYRERPVVGAAASSPRQRAVGALAEGRLRDRAGLRPPSEGGRGGHEPVLAQGRCGRSQAGPVFFQPPAPGRRGGVTGGPPPRGLAPEPAARVGADSGRVPGLAPRGPRWEALPRAWARAQTRRDRDPEGHFPPAPDRTRGRAADGRLTRMALSCSVTRLCFLRPNRLPMAPGPRPRTPRAPGAPPARRRLNPVAPSPRRHRLRPRPLRRPRRAGRRRTRTASASAGDTAPPAAGTEKWRRELQPARLRVVGSTCASRTSSPRRRTEFQPT